MPFNLGGDARFVVTWDQLKTPATLTLTFDLTLPKPRFLAWGFGNGGVGNANPQKVTYFKAGTYQLHVTAVLANGETVALDSKVTIVAGPPPPVPPNSDFSGAPAMGLVGREFDFFAAEQSKLAAAHWDFGDGSSFEGSPIASHAYAQEGVYAVCFTATAKSRLQSTTCKPVTVAPPPPKPPIPWVKLWATPGLRRIECLVKFNYDASEWVTRLEVFYGDTAHELVFGQIEHQYQTTGEWEATLLGEDPWGQRAYARVKFNIYETPKRSEDRLYGTGPQALANPNCDPTKNCDPRKSDGIGVVHDAITGTNRGPMPCWRLDALGSGMRGRCFAAIAKHSVVDFYFLQFHDGGTYSLAAKADDGGFSSFALGSMARAPNPGWWFNHVIRPRLAEFTGTAVAPTGHYDVLYGVPIPPLSDILASQH